MNVFAPFILIYIPEHQFTSTVFVSKMGNGNFSFQLSLQCPFLCISFFLQTSKRNLPTDVLYSTSEAAFQQQPSAIEHILQRAELLF